MKISTKGRYALRLMLDLAYNHTGIGHNTHITGIHKMIHYFFAVCHKLHLLSYLW
jgi:DNA-binding IscR family transcriptional regulator